MNDTDICKHEKVNVLLSPGVIGWEPNFVCADCQTVFMTTPPLESLQVEHYKPEECPHTLNFHTMQGDRLCLNCGKREFYTFTNLAKYRPETFEKFSE